MIVSEYEIHIPIEERTRFIFGINPEKNKSLDLYSNGDCDLKPDTSSLVHYNPRTGVMRFRLCVEIRLEDFLKVNQAAKNIKVISLN